MQPGPPADGTETFAGLLRRHRSQAGLSQEALAARAGLSRRGIADLERGARRSPYPDTAQRLATALRLEPEDRAAFMAACRPVHGLRPEPLTLPADPSPIVGRRRELAELDQLFADTRLLTLTGPGGIGKTRLALELAHRLLPAYADGAVLVDLAPVPDSAGVPAAFAAALGVGIKRGESGYDAVLRDLRGRAPLIILDNCEHVVTACARVADTIIRGGSAVKLLITSRESLRIHGELVWAVPPLRVDESIELFVRRADAAAAASRLTSSELATVGAMCRQLEGIPLAIELAAGRVAALGVGQVAALLARRLDFLSHGARLDSVRHQTLRAALDWSHGLLDSAEQRLFARLSVFAGGWSLEAAEAVSGPSDRQTGADPLDAVVDSLTGLVEKSLVMAEMVGGRRRYRYLETIREYALERLETSGEVATVRARQAAHLRAVIEAGAATRLGVRYPGDIARVGLEYANVRSVLHWLHDTGRFEQGLALCQALSGFWLAQGFLSEGERWLASFLAEPGRLSSHALAEGLQAWGRLAEYAGGLDRAEELFERSRAVSVEQGDSVFTARALCGLGDVAMHHAGYGPARELFGQALDAARATDSAPETAQALLSLGRVASLVGDPSGSRDWLEQALTIERRLGDRWGVAYALNELAHQERREGRLDQAQALLEECHVLWRQSGTRMGERAAVMNLSVVVLERGGTRRAAELAGEALELSVELRDAESATTVRAVEIAAQVLVALDDPATALTLVSAATGRRETLGAPRPAVEEPELDRLQHAARARLGDSGSAAAWERGRRLPMDQAVQLAVTTLAARAELR